MLNPPLTVIEVFIPFSRSVGQFGASQALTPACASVVKISPTDLMTLDPLANPIRRGARQAS